MHARPLPSSRRVLRKARDKPSTCSTGCSRARTSGLLTVWSFCDIMQRMWNSRVGLPTAGFVGSVWGCRQVGTARDLHTGAGRHHTGLRRNHAVGE